MNIKQVIQDMKECHQVPNKQTVWEHGESVCTNLNQILDFLIEGKNLPESWPIPCWLKEKEKLTHYLFSREILSRYTLYHDLGKPYCKERDEAG
jgi:hypothetical protein